MEGVASLAPFNYHLGGFMEINVQHNINFLILKKDAIIKMFGEKEYFNLLHSLLALKALSSTEIIKADTYLKLGGDV